MTSFARLAGAIVVSAVAVITAGSAAAAAIYPIDRARILAGSRFDLKVEFDQVVAPGDVRVTVNGVDAAEALGRPVRFVDNEDGAKVSSLTIADVTIDRPGTYAIQATAAGKTQNVTWEVFGTGPRRARNVILFIGDGMSGANR